MYKMMKMIWMTSEVIFKISGTLTLIYGHLPSQFWELEDIDMNEEDEIEEENEGESENDTIEATNEIIVVKVRKLVKKIRKSVQMRQKLNKCCEMYHLKYLVPIIDVSTRWNSTNEMIKRAEYLRRPLRALCAQEKNLSSDRYRSVIVSGSNYTTYRRCLLNSTDPHS